MKRALLALALVGAGAPVVHGQGCSQCRETVGETPVATQAAYRRAIAVMLVGGGTVFAGALVMFRRFR